jgi:hypothetical protein
MCEMSSVGNTSVDFECYGDDGPVVVKIIMEPGEEDRCHRLHDVLVYVYAATNARRRADVLKYVNSVMDHEGTLMIDWKRKPTQSQRDDFIEAWESGIACECGDNISHSMNGVDL